MRTNRKKPGLLLLLLLSLTLTACAGKPAQSTQEAAKTETEETTETEAAESEEEAEETETAADEAGDGQETEAETAEEETEEPVERPVLRIGSLKGPTTIGMLSLMQKAEAGEETGVADYTFTMETDPSALAAKVVGKEVDIALLPANLAAVLYGRTQGEVEVLNINTLGVLECVSSDDTVAHVADLAGRTVLTTGQGATPEYALRFLLKEAGVTDCTLEFHAEATEIAALLAENPEKIAVLPQPFATAAIAQNDALSLRFSLAEEWVALTDESALVTGVTIIRKEVWDTVGEEAVLSFLVQQQHSARTALADPETVGALAEEKGIVGKAAMAVKAMPRLGIPAEEGTVSGARMKELLSGYLQTLYEADPAAVGGALPEEDFYAVIETAHFSE